MAAPRERHLEDNDELHFSQNNIWPASNHQGPDYTGFHPRYIAKMADKPPPIQHEDSLDLQDPANAGKTKKVKNRRPASMQLPIHDRMEYGDGKRLTCDPRHCFSSTAIKG